MNEFKVTEAYPSEKRGIGKYGSWSAYFVDSERSEDTWWIAMYDGCKLFGTGGSAGGAVRNLEANI